MTTSDKTNRTPKKIILWVAISLATIALLTLGGIYGFRLCVACSIQNIYIQAAKVSRFDDFSSIQDDFETVAELVFEHKDKLLKCERQWLNIGESKDNEPYLRNIEFEIELTDEEKESVCNVHNAYYNEGDAAYLDMVFFINNDKDLLFISESGYYAMVYAPSDEPNTEEIEGYMGKNAGIVKLADCWYQVIKP